MNAATWATLAIELSLGVLIWNKRARPWVLAAGILLHLGIDFNIEIGIFSYAMLVMYVAWIAPATTQQLPDTIKARRHPAADTAAPRPPTPSRTAATRTGTGTRPTRRQLDRSPRNVVSPRSQPARPDGS